MKRAAAPPPDPDDLFADTRMSFGEHIEDLRTHLLRAVYGFFIAFIIAIPLGKPILRFIAAPVERELDAYYERYNADKEKEVKAELKEGKFSDIPPITTKVLLNRKKLAGEIASELGLPVPENKVALDGMMQAFEDFLDQLEVHHLVDWKSIHAKTFIEMDAKLSDPLGMTNDLQRYVRMVRPSRLSTVQTMSKRSLRHVVR